MGLYSKMPKLFCDKCHNILVSSTANDQLTFKCQTCFTVYKGDDDDTLRFEETKGGNIGIFRKILDTAADDPVNLKAYVDCPKCKHNIAKRVRLGKEMKLLNVCIKCKTLWMNV